MGRFICCADLHLGKSPDLGLTPQDHLDEQERVWDAIIHLATERDADAILFAGDAFEGPLPTPEHYAAFARPLSRTDVPVLMVTGNGRHDAAVRTTSAPETLTAFRDDDHIFRLSRRPEAIPLSCGVTVCTLPWTPVARLVAQADGGDRDDINQQSAELLIAAARELREQVEGPAVLLAHWSVSGSSLPTGLPVDQLREPVLPLYELEYMGWDAVVLGHIHRAQQFSVDPDEPNIPVFYCGSPLALDFGEWAGAHGCWVLDVPTSYDTPQKAAALVAEFVPLRSRRLLTVDMGFAADPAVLALVQGAVVKLRDTFPADEPLDTDVMRVMLEEAGAYKVLPFQIDRDRPARARVEGLDEATGPLDALEQYLAAQGVNGQVGAALLARAGAYLERTRA